MVMRCGTILALVFGAMAGVSGRAQAPVGAPAFEVASVRLSPPGGDGLTAFSLYDGPTVTLRNAALPLLMQLAFGVEAYQIAGLPKWADDASYDISASTGGTVALTHEEVKLLLQKLLAERLHLTVHRAMKEFKGYGLVVAKGGPKLVVTKGAGPMGQIFPGGLRASNIDVKTIGAMLGNAAGRPVVDKTALPGITTWI
jgi:uncharacterized protein (TIGR03435 family)